MGEWEDLLLPGRQLLEVQRPVSPPCPLLSYISRRFMVDSGSPPFPRDAQDWLFGCYDSNQVQDGEFEEQLVSERTISSNPFLNEETQEDFGVGDEVLDVVPFDERGEVLEWGSNPKSTQTRIPRNNQ